MYRMIHGQGLKQLLKTEAPTGVAALAIAELFYKFHSFLLEAIAFLVTWYVLGFLLKLATDHFSGTKGEEARS